MFYPLSSSTIIHNGKPFFVPEFDSAVVLYPCLAVRIGRLGKCVAERFAERYVSGFIFSFHARAADILNLTAFRGEAVNFDGSVILGTETASFPTEEMTIMEDAAEAIVWKPADVWREAIVDVSRYNSLKTGDLILTSFGAKGIEAKIGTRLEIHNAESVVCGFNVR